MKKKYYCTLKELKIFLLTFSNVLEKKKKKKKKE